MSEVDKASSTSAFAPFQRRAFRWLWLGVVISSVGLWAQTVGAQWLFVSDPNAATIVTLVQTATSLPMMMLALPAGVLSDAFDRRWMLFGIQLYFIVVAIGLAVLTALDLMPPVLLLGFTFAMGVGMALQIPTWQPLIADLVPRSQIAAATRLDMVSVNVARAAGPAIAGVLIARWGVPLVFAFNAVCVTLLAIVLLAWRRPATVSENRERFLPGLRAGGRYVRHEPAVRTILIRLACFIAPGCAVWALLPLIASRALGLDSGGYGLLFAALGIGAVAGALGLSGIKERLSSNALLGVGTLVFALSFGLTVVAPGLWVAFPLLILAGLGWTAVVSTFNAEMQLVLPSWVRARGLAVNLMVFTGAQAFASPLWGLLTQYAGLRTAVFTSAALVALSAAVGFVVRVPENENRDRAPLAYWGDVSGIDVQVDSGPVQVMVEYDVPAEVEEEWLEAMQAMRRSRLRSGAFRWELFRVGERPQEFVELFAVSSWSEHRHQHDIRLTAEDQAIEEKAFSFVSSPIRGRHLLPPEALDPEIDAHLRPDDPHR